MKIERAQGCVCDGISVDGKDIVQMSAAEETEAVKQLFAAVLRGELEVYPTSLWRILDQIKPTYSYESEEACDECGDYVIFEKWEFEYRLLGVFIK